MPERTLGSLSLVVFSESVMLTLRKQARLHLDDTRKAFLVFTLFAAILIGYSAGVAESFRHWQRNTVELESVLERAVSDLDTLIHQGASSRQVQALLGGVALGSGLPWLSYQIGDQRWDALTGGPEFKPAAEVVYVTASRNGTLQTRIGSYSLAALNMPVALLSGVLAFFAFAIAECLLRSRSGVREQLFEPEQSSAVYDQVRAVGNWLKQSLVGCWHWARRHASAWPRATRATDTREDDHAWEVLRLRQQYSDLLHDTAERVRIAERKSALRHIVEKVTHEIRNPMASMQTSLTHLQLEAGDSSPTFLRATNRLERSIGRIENLLGDLLQFSDAYRHRDEWVDVSSALARLLSTFAPQQDINVRVEVTGNCRVRVDAVRFNSIVLNVLDNAVLAIAERAQSDQGHRGEILVSSWARGDRIYIAVDDNGTGINPELTARMFEPLYSTRPKGFGLGLAITKQFVDHYGGSVRAISKSRGARIELMLPGEEEPQAVASQPIGPISSSPI